QENKDFFQNFILDFEETLKQKSRQYECGDHVDINAMSELYNVRVQVYELNKATNKLYRPLGNRYMRIKSTNIRDIRLKEEAPNGQDQDKH
ncbi:hypothetical protein RFI_36337, partial [Reticulomyxa filosa]